MAITDPGTPSQDPWTTLKTFIESNMESPDGVWTVEVNPEWLKPKKQKTYQICIMPIIGRTEEFTLEGNTATAAKITDLFFSVTLYGGTREQRWGLYTKFTKLFQNYSLCCPMDETGYTGVGGSDWHFAVIERSEQTVDIRFIDDVCGPGLASDMCQGYRAEITVMMRCNE